MFVKKKETTNQLIDYIDEKLISSLDYKVNQIYNLLDKNVLNYVYELKDNNKIPKENSTYNLTEYIHYTFGIEKKIYELDSKTKIKKSIYHGFLAINNITIENRTDIIINLYLNELNEKINKRFLKKNEKFRHLHEKNIILINNDKDNFTQPIISFDFYKNGEIKQIYIPDNLCDNLINYLYNTLNKFIPKLNESLFCKNITEELNKYNIENSEMELNNILEEYNKTKNFSNISLEYLEDYRNRRRLNKVKTKNYTKYKIISSEKKNMRKLDSSIPDFNNDFNEEIEYIDRN